ncbi:MAG: transporter [Edaphobacter sp.]|nr:transporter [Edaphobacter sp.]
MLNEITPKAVSGITDVKMQAEINTLQGVRPHALITTNYDQFLETVFPEYQPVIGQSIIQGTQILTGEIFKIHGCVSDYPSLVFTQEDYEEFARKKKYLSAKLLTYFSEHPLQSILLADLAVGRCEQFINRTQLRKPFSERRVIRRL